MSRNSDHEARTAKENADARQPSPQHLSTDEEELDKLDAESADSFPASDPPSTSVPTTLGAEKPGHERGRR
ncbi:MAG TPA: hypothetical protein VH916_04110 [Dehalococcoidia bacterium]|jgi:hypothetical protein